MMRDSEGIAKDVEEQNVDKTGHLERSLIVEQAVYSQEFNALPEIRPEKIHKVTPVQR